MARVNYQREKRLKDLDRQAKQEEKRARKLQKDLPAQTPVDADTAPVENQDGLPQSQEPIEP